MKHEQILKGILRELTVNAELISAEELERFAEVLCDAKHIFVAGAGRSGFAARAFSNRLMHLGLEVFLSGNQPLLLLALKMYLLLDRAPARQEVWLGWQRKQRGLGLKLSHLRYIRKRL